MSSRLRPGGTLAAYVWDYRRGHAVPADFWESAVELDSRAADLDERQRFRFATRCFGGPAGTRGLDSVDVQALEIVTPFPDFDSYWAPFLGGTGPAPSYVGSFTDRSGTVEVVLDSGYAPTADGPVQLTARAWAVRGCLIKDRVKHAGYNALE